MVVVCEVCVVGCVRRGRRVVLVCRSYPWSRVGGGKQVCVELTVGMDELLPGFAVEMIIFSSEVDGVGCQLGSGANK